MVCLLVDDWVYMDVDGKVGVYGLQELDRNLKSKLKKLNVAFLDYQTKHISLIDQKDSYQEALIHSSYDDNYLIAQERISTHLIQVIGAKKNRIEEIYRNLSGTQVEFFVPYAVAVRAFLKSKELLNANECVIFLDDLKNQTVLTIFEGGAFSSPRKIGMRDANYLVTEIKRSWQNFILERSVEGRSVADMPFVLISNNQEWLRSFIEQGYLLKENIAHINHDFAVLEGLKNAKFSVHFAPAHDILRQKKKQLWKNRFKTALASVLLVSIGISSYVLASIYKGKEQEQYKLLQRQEGLLDIQLHNAYQQKFLSFLSRQRLIDYTKIYSDFVQSIPGGYVIDNFFFKRNEKDRWIFQGEIYPADEYVVQEEFRAQQTFLKGDVSTIISKKSLGQRIVLEINQKDRGL